MNDTFRFSGWRLQTSLLGAGLLASVIAVQGVDQTWTQALGENRWPELVDVMGRTLFEGQAMGGGDPVVLYLLAVIVGYYLGWKRPGGRAHAWRPHFGFVITSAAVWALGLVHALKWSVGRARPHEVFHAGAPFSAWYEIGPHFVSEGIYHGSIPSGHTAQAMLLVTLCYLLAAAGKRRPGLRPAAWTWGLLSLGFAAAMGIARSMALSHWLTDVAAGLFLTWIGMHVTYHWILRVPGQMRFFRRTGRWPQAPEVWELRLSAWLVGALAGAAAGALGIRALFRPEDAALAVLAPAGAAAAAVCLSFARSLRKKALAELDGPAA